MFLLTPLSRPDAARTRRADARIKMFNRVFKELEEDPFFKDHFHRDTNLHLFRSPGPAPQEMSRSLFPFDNMDLMRNPFGLVDNMISNMRNRLGTTQHLENGNINGHSFSSSSVTTYSKVGNEPPRVFQACSSTRRAPGGIKETRRAVKDSESGVEKMSIGHHIQDRGHVMQKKYNQKTGEKELNQDFHNLDESEAETFDEEWKRNVSQFQCDGFMSVKPGSITFTREQSHREPTRVSTKREPGSKRQ